MAENRFCPECNEARAGLRCPVCEGPTYVMPAEEAEKPDPHLGLVLDGRYRLDERIGIGGMGAVYRATRLSTGATVAIKLIRSEFAQRTEIVRYFHREARTASALTHPHTVRVYDFGQTEAGELYLVMEHLVGTSLHRLIRQEAPLEPRRAARIAAAIAQALAEAHGKGLIHRDLKPENVMLLDAVGQPDFVKVLDFGLAKFFTGEEREREQSLTKAGHIVGTPHYMSPERARGDRSVTGAADVYALGVILYEMLGGVRPFDGDSPLRILTQHNSEPVPPLPGREHLPRALVELTERMLAKEARDRPTAPEVFTILEEEAITGPVPRLRSRPELNGVESVGVPSATDRAAPELPQRELATQTASATALTAHVGPAAAVGSSQGAAAATREPAPSPPVGAPLSQPVLAAPAAAPDRSEPVVTPPPDPAGPRTLDSFPPDWRGRGRQGWWILLALLLGAAVLGLAWWLMTPGREAIREPMAPSATAPAAAIRGSAAPAPALTSPAPPACEPAEVVVPLAPLPAGAAGAPAVSASPPAPSTARAPAARRATRPRETAGELAAPTRGALAEPQPADRASSAATTLGPDPAGSAARPTIVAPAPSSSAERRPYERLGNELPAAPPAAAPPPSYERLQ